MRRVQEGMHVCCRIGGMLVGIDLDRVQEINRHVDPTFVPLMEPHVRGVINLRGNLVTVLDLGYVVRGATTTNGPKDAHRRRRARRRGLRPHRRRGRRRGRHRQQAARSAA
jgi:chemotaxis signal transduction protein